VKKILIISLFLGLSLSAGANATEKYIGGDSFGTQDSSISINYKHRLKTKNQKKEERRKKRHSKYTAKAEAIFGYSFEN